MTHPRIATREAAWPSDADNYACEDSACIYTGCNNDMECQENGPYLCRDGPNGIPVCTTGCDSVTDCVVNGEAHNEDNYLCTDGACEYTGCLSDDECMVDGDQVCHQP